MPELPDVTVYIEALATRIRGARLLGARLASPFVLRSVDPPLETAAGGTVTGLRRLGKRIVIELTGELFLVLHLMTPGTRPTTAPAARPGASSWPTAPSRASSGRTGPARSRSWKSVSGEAVSTAGRADDTLPAVRAVARHPPLAIREVRHGAHEDHSPRRHRAHGGRARRVRLRSSTMQNGYIGLTNREFATYRPARAESPRRADRC